MREVECLYMYNSRGIERGYVYKDKTKLISKALDYLYRHLGNYFRWYDFVSDLHQPHITTAFTVIAK